LLQTVTLASKIVGLELSIIRSSNKKNDNGDGLLYVVELVVRSTCIIQKEATAPIGESIGVRLTKES
jgi:hypothetical protein